MISTTIKKVKAAMSEETPPPPSTLVIIALLKNPEVIEFDRVVAIFSAMISDRNGNQSSCLHVFLLA